MPLDPSEIEAIARAVAAYAAIGTGMGLLAAVICGILIALKITVPVGAKMVETRMLDPKGAVQTARKAELEAFKKGVGIDAMKEDLAAFRRDLAPLLQTVDAEDENGKPIKALGLIVQINELVDLADAVRGALLVQGKDKEGNAVTVPIGDALPQLFANAETNLKNARAAGHARGDGGGGSETAIERFAGDVEWAVDNPEQAQVLAIAHQTIDSLGPMFNKSPAQIKQLHQQANDAKGTVEGLKTLMDKLNALQARSGGGQAGGATRGGGKSGPAQF